MRSGVASSATALAPFSQNSKACRPVSGLGHAHDWQSKPSAWLTCSSNPAPRTTPVAPSNSAVLATAFGPAAARLAAPSRGGAGSGGVRAGDDGSDIAPDRGRRRPGTQRVTWGSGVALDAEDTESRAEETEIRTEE